MGPTLQCLRRKGFAIFITSMQISGDFSEMLPDRMDLRGR